MNVRVQNPSGAVIAIGIVGGVALGGLLVYALLERKQIEALRAQAAAMLPTGLRLPRPDVWVHLPNEADDYHRLDATICDCVASLPAMAPDELVEAARMCAARDLFPDFPWPPIMHDHDSVHTLWAILGFLAGRAVTLQVCPVSTPTTTTIQPRPRAQRNALVGIRRPSHAR